MHVDTSLVTVQIPLPRALAEAYAGQKAPTSLPIPADIFRAALGEPEQDPRKKFSELDELIAEVLDRGKEHTAEQLAQILDTEFDHITSAAGVRDRFRTTRPLRAAGYKRGLEGYKAPGA